MRWELMSTVNGYMTELATQRLPVPSNDLERLTKGAIAYTQYGSSQGLDVMGSLRSEDFRPVRVSRDFTVTGCQLSFQSSSPTRR